jgi:hypothetical protein
MENIKDLIISMELSLLDKNIRNDKNELKNIISSDFIEYSSSGKIYTYEDCIKYLPEENKQIKYNILNIEINKLSEDIILLLYTIEMEKENKMEVSNRSSIWINKNGKWKILFHQGTIKNDENYSFIPYRNVR